MSIVHASDLGVSYGARDVFAGVSLEIPHRARIALIGPNGSGKTSLLRVVAGLDRPTAGVVRRSRGLSMGYLPQVPAIAPERTLVDELRAGLADLDRRAAELAAVESELARPGAGEEVAERYARLQARFEADGGYEIEQRIDRVAQGLGFERADLGRPLAELSGGQQTRALLGRLLLESPDLLLLDEPTNHLDVTAVEWLETWLRDWPGALLFVAHDRAFLDNVAERVWELAGGRLTSYPGNYSAYARIRADRALASARAFRRQQEEIARQEEFVRRNIAGQNTKQAQSRRRALEKLDRLEAPEEAGAAARVRLEAGRRSGDRVLKVRDAAIGYDPAGPLFTCGDLDLWWRDKVALLGPNGSGKTTFLRTIVGDVPPLAGSVRLGGGVRVGYFGQSHDRVVDGRTVLQHVLDASTMDLPAARSFLGRYRFAGDEALKPVEALSGGERARVALALLELDGANLLVLDEPTNHLDVFAQEALQEVLADFAGTVLLVSHDRFLIRALGGAVWALHGGRLLAFAEGYDAYRAWLTQSAAGDGARDDRADAWRTERRAARRAERDARRRAEDRAALEAAIDGLEARLAELERELARASTAGRVGEVTALADEHAAVRAQLEARLEAWLEDDDGDGPDR